MAASALRSALSAIDNAQAADAAPPSNSSGPIAKSVLGVGAAEVPRKELSDADVIAIVQREIAEKSNAARQYEQLGRLADAARLRAEAEVLTRYLR